MPLNSVKLETVPAIQAAVTSLGMPAPTTETVRAISRHAREWVLHRLEQCIHKENSSPAVQQDLSAFFAAIDGASLETLRSHGLSVSLDTLVPLAAARPRKLASAVRVLAEANHPRQTEAAHFVATALGIADWKAPALESRGGPTNPDCIDRIAEPPRKYASPANTHVSHHAYGSEAALCFNAIAGKDGKPPGVMIDAAAGKTTGVYDWPNAIHLWLNECEVASVVAVFKRWRTSASFTGHGRSNDRTFTIAFQRTHFFARVTAKNVVRAVKIVPQDAHAIALLFLRQLLAAYPDLPSSQVLALVESVNATRLSHEAPDSDDAAVDH